MTSITITKGTVETPIYLVDVELSWLNCRLLGQENGATLLP